MCKPGSNDSQSSYQQKTHQSHQIIVAEEHKLAHAAADAQQYAKPQQQEQHPSPYARFFIRLKPLPPSPVAGGLAPQEEKVGYKERKRQKEQYKSLGQEQRLLRENEVKALPQFQTQQCREQWTNETLPHSTLTREQTLKQILNEGDYSNFENLDGVMRNLVASKALSQFMKDYHIDEDSDPEAVCEQIKSSGEGVSALLNPALRLGLSLAQHTEDFTPKIQKFFRELDETMSTAVMVSTLTHVADKDTVINYFQNKGSDNPYDDAEKAVEANQAQQIQIAKRLLLMQLSNFQKITTLEKHRFKKDIVREEKWDKSMAVALSHCSRVVLTLPKQDQVFSNADAQKQMWKSILTTGGTNAAQDNSRASSTHSIQRRKVKNKDSLGSKEKKVVFNLIGQRGMNCAIGGLGNAGVSGKTLCNDGSCGHFYSMYKEADADHYGAMLMGLESDANAVTNQMGHTHDWHATAEKVSSLGGQRTDEVGDKYGGRQCDLSGIPASTITLWMETLERAMLHWQSQEDGMSSPDAVAAMKMLSGKQLDQQGRDTLLRLLTNAGTPSFN